MTARCGSNDKEHRVRTCRPCDRIYKRRSLEGAPPYRHRTRADAAVCVVCGVTAGNSGDIPVHRYSLKRWARDKARWIGSLGICDPCLIERGELKPEYRHSSAARVSDDGLRAYDGMPTSALRSIA
jgi:hypothetical protein